MHRIARPDGAVVVAIPAKDECMCIGRCLAALAAQRDAPSPDIVLVLNNTTDGTAVTVRDMQARLPLRIHLHEVDLPPERAYAGWARKLAMDAAADLAGPGGVVLSTDADGYVAPDWIAANLRAIAAGADAVAGMAEIDPEDAALIPSVLHEDDARECGYAALLDELDALLDPNLHDPMPRHDQHSGASIAVTAEAYRRAGGIPPLPIGEDRGLFDALARIDARIRHAPDVVVTVSGRIEGRAVGGMADTIRRRLAQPDEMLDERLEFAEMAARRSDLRRRCRAAFRDGTDDGVLAGMLAVEPARLAVWLRLPAFGAMWDKVQAESPALIRRRVPVAALPLESTRAGLLIARARVHADATARVGAGTAAAAE